MEKQRTPRRETQIMRDRAVLIEGSSSLESGVEDVREDDLDGPKEEEEEAEIVSRPTGLGRCRIPPTSTTPPPVGVVTAIVYDICRAKKKLEVWWQRKFDPRLISAASRCFGHVHPFVNHSSSKMSVD